MSNNIILTPTIVDEIEFYVSSDSRTTGISITGLSRLVGVNGKTVSTLLNSLVKSDDIAPGAGTFAAWVKPLYGEGFNVFIPGVSGYKEGGISKIVSGLAASAVVEWYAFESKHASEQAKTVFRKFARIGFDEWVRQLTGVSETNDISEVKHMIAGMLEKIDRLEVNTTRYNNIRSTSIKLYPGLDYIHSEIEDGNLLEPAEEQKPFTLTEWLESKGITLDNSRKHKLALLVSETYKTITQKEPRKIKKREPNKAGTQSVNGFVDEEVPILEIALKKLFNML